MPLTEPFAEVEGVLELRTLVEDPQGGDEPVVDREYEPPVDMVVFQREFRYDTLPEDFCQKDRYTGYQKIFYCLVCSVELKGPPTLASHVKGTKHCKKVLEYKRRRFGITEEEDKVGKPEKKKEKKYAANHGKDITLFDRVPLREHLESEKYRSMPALGLEFIEEYIGDRPGDVRQYTCTLEAPGCDNVWGGSYCLVNHLCGNKMKHNRNYLVHVAKIPGADCMTKDKVLEAAIEQEAKLRGPGEERDYEVITVSRDQKRYRELRDRPPNYNPRAEKLKEKRGLGSGGGGGQERGGRDRGGPSDSRKRQGTQEDDSASRGIPGGSANANLQPLGKKPRDRSPEERGWDKKNADLMIEKLDNLQLKIEHLHGVITRSGSDELKEIATEALRYGQYR